jgi:hypothetical protein
VQVTVISIGVAVAPGLPPPLPTTATTTTTAREYAANQGNDKNQSVDQRPPTMDAEPFSTSTLVLLRTRRESNLMFAILTT